MLGHPVLACLTTLVQGYGRDDLDLPVDGELAGRDLSGIRYGIPAWGWSPLCCPWRARAWERLGQSNGTARAGRQAFDQELRILEWWRRQPGSLCFQTPGLEPVWLSFPIPHPILHTALPLKPQLRISHGCRVQNDKLRELVARWRGLRWGAEEFRDRVAVG